MNYFLFRHVDFLNPGVCGCAMLNPGWQHMKRRMENETVLIYGKKNTALINENGEVLEVRPGRIVLLPANRWHVGEKPITEAASYYWLHFSTSIVTEDEKRYFLPKSVDEAEALTILSSPEIAYQRLEDSIVLPQYFDVINTSSVTNLFNEILQEYAKPSCSPLNYKFKVQRLLMELYGECFKTEHTFKKESGSQSLVRQALIILQEQLSNKDASVKYLASELNVSADYLGRCFKDAMHISIGRYIQQKRIDLACSRLRDTSDSIDTILQQCGFGSRRQFYDEFKAKTGETPAVYRSKSSAIGVNIL